MLIVPQQRKRNSSPHPLPAEPSSKSRSRRSAEFVASSSFLEDDAPQLTMEEKLRVAQIEAETAGTCAPTEPNDNDELDLELDDDVGRLPSPVKKTKIKGRPRRRKSTLSPEELENLLGLE